MFIMLFVLQSVFLFAMLAVFPSVLAAEESGPTAVVSINSKAEYVTARPCGASCLWYQGPFACGANRGYFDLAQELQCGCDARNACYCGKDNAVAASSYISSCVSDGCSKFPGEVTSAIAIYNDYCVTANIVAATTSVAPATTSGSSTGQTATATRSDNTRPTLPGTIGQTSGSPSTTSTPSATTTREANSGNKGLSQSDIIAIGVGLGVGIPSLLIAFATFYLMTKKNKNDNSSQSWGRI